MMFWCAPMPSLAIVGLTTAILAVLPQSQSSAAPSFDASLQAPGSIEAVACRNVRERLLLPGGRVEYVTRQDCSSDSNSSGTSGTAQSGCRQVRERVLQPNGSVAYLSVNRCN